MGVCPSVPKFSRQGTIDRAQMVTFSKIERGPNANTAALPEVLGTRKSTSQPVQGGYVMTTYQHGPDGKINSSTTFISTRNKNDKIVSQLKYKKPIVTRATSLSEILPDMKKKQPPKPAPKVASTESLCSNDFRIAKEDVDRPTAKGPAKIEI